MLITLVSALALSLKNYDADTIFTSVKACISNVGPGLGFAGSAEILHFIRRVKAVAFTVYANGKTGNISDSNAVFSKYVEKKFAVLDLI